MRRDHEYDGESAMPVSSLDPSVGLCVNCSNNATCAFCGSQEHPKYFCEEYECMGASCGKAEPEIAVVRSKPTTVSEAFAGESGPCNYLGLCVNCENKESCCHTTTEGGVWFCEEYR